jgi:hypothetical protein
MQGLHTLHDHWFASLLYGEAFLDDDMLAYFDGRHLTLCAYRLGMGEPGSPRDLAAWTRKWVRQTGAGSLMLVSPRIPDLRALERDGLQRFHTWPARPIAQEVIAICPPHGASPVRRHRRALAAPYALRTSRGGSVPSQKLRLIERFQRGTGVTPYLAGLTTAWLAILMASEVQFVEAWKDDVLVGFVAVRHSFDRGAVAMAMARDTDARGVADFLYAHMLALGSAAGWEWINLSSSVTRGQQAFKQKWGALSPLPAYALSDWRRAALSRKRYLLWGPRTMQKSSP